jgi:FkbM family methyltransferase
MKIYTHDPRFILNGRENSFPDAVVAREIWCENVYEVFDGDFSDTGIVVDIGANIGSFSLYAGSLGAKKVIAVEPEPHNLELLRQNILENSGNIPDCEYVVDDRGIGGSAGKAYITDEHGDSKVIRHKGMEQGVTEITIIDIQQLWKDHDLEFVDVLKIDIEGLEGEVILNATKETLNLCRYITMEYDRRANDLGAIVEKLSRTHQIKYVGEQGGMIFAKRY